MTTKFLEHILDKNYEFKRTLDIKSNINKINKNEGGKNIERKKSNLENYLNKELYDGDFNSEEELNEEYLVFQE